jgi:hypothetical protein
MVMLGGTKNLGFTKLRFLTAFRMTENIDFARHVPPQTVAKESQGWRKKQALTL